MDSLNRKSTDMKNESSQKSRVGDAANDLLNESKKLANELYEDGCGKLSDAEQHLKDYSEHFTRKIHEKPFTSLLIAGGIGYLISRLFKK